MEQATLFLTAAQQDTARKRMRRHRFVFDIVRTLFWGTFVAFVPGVVVRLGVSKPEDMPTFDPITWSGFLVHLPWLTVLWIGCLLGFWYYYSKQAPTIKEMVCGSCGKSTKAREDELCGCGGELVARRTIPKRSRPRKSTQL